MMRDKIEVPFTDLPAWAQAEARARLGARCKPRTYIKGAEVLDLGPVWHDAARRYVAARNAQGQIKRGQSCYYDSILNSTRQEIALHQGGQTELPLGCAVLEIIQDPWNNTATLWRHPGDMPKRVAEPKPELTPIQRHILRLCGYKAKYRNDERRQYRIPTYVWETVVHELMLKELVKVSRNGAISVTRKARNGVDLIAGPSPYGYFSEWARNGERERVIAQYRTRPI